MAAAVLVVELALRNRVVDVDRWEWERAILDALIEAEYAGGCFFRKTADGFNERRVLVEHHVREIATVVENHVERLAILAEGQRLLDAPVEFFFVHALPCKHLNAGLCNCSSGVVLRREDVAARPCDFSTEVDKCLDEHSCLDCHVETARNACTLQWLLALELLTECHQTWHFNFGETDLLATPLGEVHVGNGVLSGLVSDLTLGDAGWRFECLR